MHRRLLFALAFIGPGLPALGQTCDDPTLEYDQRIAVCDQAFAASLTAEEAAYALSLKGEAQRLSGQTEAAAETLQLALSYTPANAWVWVELGNVRYDQGDMAGALAHYSAALAVEDYGTAWANRAETWWEFRMGAQCLSDAENALRIDPRDAYANELKGRCLFDLGRSEEAIGFFDTALALVPGYQNAYRNKIAALASLGRHEEAVAVADEALTPGVVINPFPEIEEDILARRLLSLSQYAAPDTVTAEAERLLQRYPGNPAAINIQARALLAEQKAAEADALTADLRAKAGDLAMEGLYYDTLAQIDLALGRLPEALENYEQALTLSPDLSRIYARKLSELGFLPLSNSPAGVLTALQRCMDVKQTACQVSG